MYVAAEKTGYSEIDLDLIHRGSSQARQVDVCAGMDDLIASIKSQGLMAPIHLVEIEKDVMYELVVGQRRFLAFLILRKSHPERFAKIPSFLYRNTAEFWEKKTFSLHSNLSQAPMEKIDRVNAVTTVYDHFNSIKKTAENTGLSPATIRKYVELSRLPENMGKAVQKREISMRTALATADLYEYDPGGSKINVDEMLDAAREMQRLTEKQRVLILYIKRDKPDRQIRDIITDVVSNKRIKHDLTISVESDTYERINTYRENRGAGTIPLAAVELVEAGLDANEEP